MSWMSSEHLMYVQFTSCVCEEETRNDRWKTDKFACMRQLFEDMNERDPRIRHGKPEKVGFPAAKSYVTKTEEYSKYLINELSIYCNLQGINISMDRYLPSVSLATWTLEKNICIVGNMKHNLKGIPKELKPVADREKKPAMLVSNRKKKIMLVSYIDKQ